jgi:methylase of polypeptide subunit release factors
MNKLIIKYLHKLYSFIISNIRHNKKITKFIFKFEPIDNGFGDYWDWTTITLKNIVEENLTKKTSFLDIGTGPYGILANFASQNIFCNNIVGLDHCSSLITSAEKNKISDKIKFVESDLFDKIDEKYDLIVFNAPYIDNGFGSFIDVLTDDLSEKRWSGGKDGTVTISRFLSQVSNYLTEDGKAVLGVNHFYVSDIKIKKLIEMNKLLLITTKKNPVSKSCGYILQKGIK